MEIQSVKLVYFSPTGTSKAIVHAISQGIGCNVVETIDITNSKIRKQELKLTEKDLLIFAVPVYMGRVPALLNNFIQSIEASNTPAVCVVVYGNREFDDALLELRNLLTERGCVPIAGAAYLGEHSFSIKDYPIAEGRPNQEDLDHAQGFGRIIAEKLQTITNYSLMDTIDIPGNMPYKEGTKLWDVDFIEVSDDCLQCGVCAEICPVEAISFDNSRIIDIEKCITCCACIKSCPKSARSIKPSPVMDAAIRLNTNFSHPKDPELFV
ncbi:MAG: EFR1 family ferrodoxin [Bacteroidales bacterium]